MATTKLFANAVSESRSFQQLPLTRTIYHHLQGAGLVREETHNQLSRIIPRNRLYEEYLRPRLQA